MTVNLQETNPTDWDKNTPNTTQYSSLVGFCQANHTVLDINRMVSPFRPNKAAVKD